MHFSFPYKLSNKLNSIILFLAFIFTGLLSSPLYNNYGMDREVCRYMGMLISNGKAPYVDALDNKPPVTYLINYLGVLLTPSNPWGIFLITQLFTLLSLVLLINVCKKQLSIAYQLLIPLLYLALINHPNILEGGNLARQYCVFLITILLALPALNINKALIFFISGILSALIFLTQPNEVLACIPFVLGAIFLNENYTFQKVPFKNLIKNYSIIFLGCCTIFIFILAIIMYWHAGQDFLEQAFIKNSTKYLIDYPWRIKLGNTFYGFLELKINIILLQLTILFISFYYLLKNKKMKVIHLLFIFIFVIQLFSTSLRGIPFSHYFLIFIPYFIFFIILISNSLMDNFSFSSTLRKINIFFLCISILYFTFFYTVLLLNKKKSYSHNPDFVATLKEIKNKPYQLYCFYTPYLALNTDFNSISASRIVFSGHADERKMDDKSEIVPAILKDLKNNACPYIIYSEKLFADRLKINTRRLVREFLYQHYQAISYDENGVVLYKIKKKQRT